MLKRIILAVVFAIVAYLLCTFVGAQLATVKSVDIAVSVGNFLNTYANLIALLVFLYFLCQDYVNGLFK